ncbi:tetratricopeptide repeat protein [Limibacillus sp. MBR-115]|jgi:tetratricopeptide (TPR) repeat protein|uniref:tetratricopeptide repeat protein n=1 Tax=Limibacillus sp. MBR-115 TaxID=3156465 RepID=UPI00339ADFDA
MHLQERAFSVGALASAVLLALLIALPGGGGGARADLGGDSGTNDPFKEVRALIVKEQYEAALVKLDGLQQSQAKNADLYSLKGFATRKLGRYQEAEGYYDQALAIDDEHIYALEYLGELYLETNRLAEAEKVLERLDDACGFFGCEEEEELKQAIAAYKAKNGG